MLALTQATAAARVATMLVPGKGDKTTAATSCAAGQLAGELVDRRRRA